MPYKPNRKLSEEQKLLHGEARRRFLREPCLVCGHPGTQHVDETEGCTICTECLKYKPAKCFQAQLRDVQGEKAGRRPLAFDGTERVIKISTEQAKAIIEDYEWFGTMGAGTVACYGLEMHGELLGVACLNRGLGPENRNICGPEYADKAVSITRGACVPWAPPMAASKLIRWTCKLAHRDYGWSIFFAYSDEEAGEVGTVYQATGWKYLGVGNGRPQRKQGPSYHSDFVHPEGPCLASDKHDCTQWAGKTVTNYYLAKNRVKLAALLGLRETNFRAALKETGWKHLKIYDKARYVWFEGTREERDALEAACKYPFQPYPKRKRISAN